MAQADHARAVEQQAALNLSYTRITAPVDGTVGARTLRVGQYVGAGTQLMAVVPLDAVYVVANFKETQLTNVRSGQPVELRIDGFRKVKLTGHVDSLSPASGLEFALLPPDNATGNFTKIVQRVPVKIVLDDHKLAGLLRPGMSAEPAVDTKATVLAERDRQAAVTRLAAAEHVQEHAMTAIAINAATSVTSGNPRRCVSAAGGIGENLARRVRRHARRLHGGAQHPDRQRLARRHPGRDRRRHRRRRLDLDLLPDRRDRGDSLKRLARTGIFAAPLSAHQRDPVHDAVGRLRVRAGSCRR